MANIIYGLIDPRTQELRYIGQSRVGIIQAKRHTWSDRLTSRRSDKKLTYKQNWILNLLKNNLKPEIIILENCNSPNDLNEAEIFFISYFKSLGCRLTNHALGGHISVAPKPRPKGYKHSQDTILKMKLAASKRIIAPEHLEKFIKAGHNYNKGKKRKPETIEKIRKVHLGRKTSLEARIKQSKAKDYKKIRLEDQYGNKYDSICDAVRKTGCSKINIRYSLKGLKANTKHYIFKRIE